MTDFINGLAEQDFYKAKTRALLSRLYHLFKPEDEDLLPFEEAKKLLSPGGEVYTGVTAVPLDRIVGSEGRYRDFNRHFLPKKEHLRQRWISVDKTRYTDVILPPVRLYEMGGVYFVRDGNHRVSVARSMGQIEIDAEVISLQSKIGILPDATIDEVKQAVIAYEKAIFEEQTHYGTVIGHDDLDFSEPGRYETIQEHINVHKYYLNEHQPVEISFPSALWSWHENVYSPVVLAIREERLLTLFPGRTEGDLYLYLVRHWHELKYAHKREIGIGDAARDFRQRAGATIPSFFRSLLEKCQKWFGRGDLFKK